MYLKRQYTPVLAAGLFFLVILTAHFLFTTKGWNNSIGEPQEFRQSQTAIASYYIAEEGPMIATKIPVLGPDWRIPFEFPTYQTVVAGVHKLTGIPLDQAGRTVSLIAFYLCLLPMGLLLRRLGFSKPDTLMVLCLVLASPVYIFWSRTFLIETLSVLLALLYLTAILQFQGSKKLWMLGTAVFLGSLAAVTKFTTFSIFFGFVILLLGARSLYEAGGSRWLGNKRVVSGVVAALLVPVLAGWLWSQYIQHVWLQSPLTRGLGDSIHQWNFGTWDLRTTPEFWGRFYEYSVSKITYNFLPWIIAIGGFVFAQLRFRLIGLCALAAWLSGPLVWANLFYVHDYYSVETGFFALVFISVGITGIARRWPSLKTPTRIVMGVLALCLLLVYPKTAYYRAQEHDWGQPKAEFAREVGERIPNDSVLLVIGDDWNPMIPYYSGKYALMLRWKGHSRSKEFAEAVRRMESEGKRIGGAVVRTGTPGMEEETNSLLSQFGLSPAPSTLSQSKNYAYHPLEKNSTQ